MVEELSQRGIQHTALGAGVDNQLSAGSCAIPACACTLMAARRHDSLSSSRATLGRKTDRRIGPGSMPLAQAVCASRTPHRNSSKKVLPQRHHVPRLHAGESGQRHASDAFLFPPARNPGGWCSEPLVGRVAVVAQTAAASRHRYRWSYCVSMTPMSPAACVGNTRLCQPAASRGIALPHAQKRGALGWRPHRPAARFYRSVSSRSCSCAESAAGPISWQAYWRIRCWSVWT